MKIQSLTKLTSTFTFTFLATVLLMACTSKASHEPVPEPELRIGVIVYTDEEVERISTVNAADMAVEKVNAGEGLTILGQKHKVTWIREDVRGAVPEESVAAVKRLINQGEVVAIVGPQYSSDAIPAGEIAEISGIPLISPISTNHKTPLSKKFVFSMGLLDDFQGKVAAHFLLNDLDLKRIAVFYNVANPYSRGIASVFKKSVERSGKGRIVTFESYTTDEVDLTSQLTRIKDSEPQAVYLPNFSQETTKIAAKAREMGITSLLVGGDGWDRTGFSQIVEFEGAYMTAHYSADIRTPENESFVKEYMARYGLTPGDTAALTYDAFNMIFNAIKHQGNTDPVSIRDGLYSMGPFEGVGGDIDFTDTGDPKKGAVILQFTDGKVRFVRIVKPN